MASRVSSFVSWQSDLGQVSPAPKISERHSHLWRHVVGLDPPQSPESYGLYKGGLIFHFLPLANRLFRSPWLSRMVALLPGAGEGSECWQKLPEFPLAPAVALALGGGSGASPSGCRRLEPPLFAAGGQPGSFGCRQPLPRPGRWFFSLCVAAGTVYNRKKRE